MPFFNSASPFDPDVEKATNEMNTVEDWSLLLDICDKVARQPNGAKDCLKSIVKRLNHKVPFVSMQALTLLDACVNNCGRIFHLEICSRDFVSECRTLMGQKAHPKVAQRLSLMIKQWAEMREFKDDPALNLIPSFYDSLRKEGMEFVDSDAKPKTTTSVSQVRKEEDDIAKAIALSLKAEGKGVKVSGGGAQGGLYPSQLGGSPAHSRPAEKEARKVRALYDFEAAEDNELTFRAGELMCVLDDSDPNWWKGSNHRGEGLFPANFVTSDLSVDLEPDAKTEKKSVQFNEQVEVKSMEAGAPLVEAEIDEARIDEVLGLIQNADPTGEMQPDSGHMLALEEQCRAMGPLIDNELEKIDRNHANLVGLNQKVMEALQMYHSLMKETPAYSYAGIKAPQGAAPSMYAPVGNPGMAMASQPPYAGQYMGSMPGSMGQGSAAQLGMAMSAASFTQAQSSQPTFSTQPSPSYTSLPPQQPPQAMSGPLPPHPQFSSGPPAYSQPISGAPAYSHAPPNMAAMYHAPSQQPLL